MKTETRERVVAGTLIALIVIGVLIVLAVIVRLVALVLLVVVAGILTAGIDPLARRLQEKWHLPRALAIVLIMLFVVVVVLGIVWFLVVTAVAEGIHFAQNTWPAMQAKLLAFADRLHDRYPLIPKLDVLYERLRAQSGEVAGYVWSTTRAVFGVLGSLVSIITVIILTFFFANSQDDMTRTFARFVPPAHRAHVLGVTHLMGLRMGGWVRGQLLLAVIIAGTVFVGMTVLDVPYAALIAALGGMGEMVPMVGPYVAFVPALAIVLATGAPLWKVVVVIVFFIALAQVEAYVLSPRIMQRAVGLAPVTTVLALITGGTLFGLVGAVLAIPVAAGGRVLLRELVFPAIEGTVKPEAEK